MVSQAKGGKGVQQPGQVPDSLLRFLPAAKGASFFQSLPSPEQAWQAPDRFGFRCGRQRIQKIAQCRVAFAFRQAADFVANFLLRRKTADQIAENADSPSFFSRRASSEKNSA